MPILDFRISPVISGDAIEIERKLSKVIDLDGDMLDVSKTSRWSSYCRVNTGATESTMDAAKHVLNLLQEAEKLKSGDL